MLQLLSCSIWVTLGTSHCRREEQLSTSMAEPREQALCHQHTWPPPSNLPSWCPDISMLAFTPPQHTILCTACLGPCGSSVSPHPGRRHSLGSAPTLISLLFCLEDLPAILASLGLEGLGTARVKPPWSLPSL